MVRCPHCTNWASKYWKRFVYHQMDSSKHFMKHPLYISWILKKRGEGYVVHWLRVAKRGRSYIAPRKRPLRPHSKHIGLGRHASSRGRGGKEGCTNWRGQVTWSPEHFTQPCLSRHLISVLTKPNSLWRQWRHFRQCFKCQSTKRNLAFCRLWERMALSLVNKLPKIIQNYFFTKRPPKNCAIFQK